MWQIRNTCILFSEINSTLQTNGELIKTEEDVLYQKGASFSAKLDSSHQRITNSLEENSSSDSSDDSESDESFINSIFSLAPDADDLQLMSAKLAVTGHGTASRSKTNRTELSPESTISPPSPKEQSVISQNRESSYYTSKEDMSVFDDVNNNRLNLRHANVMYQDSSYDTTFTSILSTTTPATAIVTKSVPTETSPSYIHINEYRAGFTVKDTRRPETLTLDKDYRLGEKVAANISR